MLSYINAPLTNLLVAVTVGQLSTHAEDEQFLDEPNELLTVSGDRGGGGEGVRGGTSCQVVVWGF